ncbi:MAG: hypothetical protein AB7H88_16020 [Vicinamibacterales bacterium]
MLSARVQLHLITGWFLLLVALLGVGAAAGLRLSTTEGVGLFVLATIPAGILLKALAHAPRTAAEARRPLARPRGLSGLAPRAPGGDGLR